MKIKFLIYPFLVFLLLTACTSKESDKTLESVVDNWYPYESERLGISTLIHSDWVPFWPDGVFVREMPTSDPSFLVFGSFEDVTTDQFMEAFIASIGLNEVPENSSKIETDSFNWDLYNLEINEGFLLSYYPDYGTMMFDGAVVESDGGVIAVAFGSPVEERDKLFSKVFLPAIQNLELFDPTSARRESEVVSLPERDYWPTEEWRTSTPAEQGMDGGKLSEMVAYIKKNKIPINNTLIVRHGYIVLDENFRSYQLLDSLQSVTKSFTSALIGIAIDKGLIEGVDQSVVSAFPMRQIANLDDRKRSMTIEDLLTMRAGIDWPPGPCSWLDGRECGDYTTIIMFESEDSVQFILDQPMIADPGTSFVYNSGASHLLSALITERTGKSALAFAEENLFQPLGIQDVRWTTDSQGLNLGWSDIKLYPQDMAKFGYLYLNGGQWDGEQVISSEWIKTSVMAHTETGSRGIQPNYGYQWWVNPELGYYNAAGWGGNYIIVVPEYDMVVIFTGELYSMLGDEQWWEGTPEELFRVYILQAVE